jgi:LysM repeat protein
MQKCLITFFSCFVALCCNAQRITAEQYIEQYKDIAISEMKRMGVPAAITLAQGLLETESGNSELVKKSNNHFGIKCKNTWTGASVTHDDDATGECFRAYENAEESFRDHSNFLRGNTRYGSLFRLEPTDYRGWAYGLKKAGYATNPLYPEILIKNIEQYNLQQYTLKAVSELPDFDPSKYKDDSVVTAPVVVNEARINDIKDSSAESIVDAPDKIITINNSKCVLAGKGVSLLVIAIKNKINLSRLLEYNELAEDGILAKDQYVYLQKKSKTGEKDYYIVQEGEGIYDIAQKNGIQLQYLLDYNNLKNGDAVIAGTKLFLKPGLKVTGKEKAALNKTRIHIVAAKEGLYGIAREYNVTVEQLREWNNLTSDELKKGQQLIVSE